MKRYYKHKFRAQQAKKENCAINRSHTSIKYVRHSLQLCINFSSVSRLHATVCFFPVFHDRKSYKRLFYLPSTESKLINSRYIQVSKNHTKTNVFKMYITRMT